jgi:DNA-binding LacI/PurR family transcriptional regulator
VKDVMKGSAKLADVAKAAGVSAGTASNVFNRPEIVSPEVRSRVEAAARRLGYNGPDPKGRLLRAGKVNAIGVVTSDDTADAFQDPYTRLVMRGVAEECDARGAGLALVSTKQSESAWRIQTALVDGFIVSCYKVDDAVVALAQERKLPFVSLDLDAGPGTSSVLIEDRRGAALAAAHVLELGHRRIGILSLPGKGCCEDGPTTGLAHIEATASRFMRDRLAGYRDALAAHGLTLEQVPVVELPGYHDATVRALVEFLGAHPDLTALVAMADLLALAALEAARARGLRVPEDLSIVGFDDVIEAAESDPPLTTVAQPAYEKGRLAARMIFEGGPPRSELLPVKLVVRGSTARPRA